MQPLFAYNALIWKNFITIVTLILFVVFLVRGLYLFAVLGKHLLKSNQGFQYQQQARDIRNSFLLDYITSLSNHTHRIVPILVDENIHKRCLKLLYCDTTQRWNWQKNLKRTPILYGCPHPYKFLVTNVWRHFHSVFVYFRFGRLGVGKTVESYPP